MKYLLLKSLSEWSLWSPLSSSTGFMDFLLVKFTVILCSSLFYFLSFRVCSFTQCKLPMFLGNYFFSF